jgi:alpha-ketoglutarate-dependent dioxygenase alkB family protein 3
MIRNRLHEVLNYKFNSVLGNFYRDGKDSVAWHSDDEPMLGKHPYIASLSFGDLRMFEMRRKPSNPNPTSDDYDFVQHVKIPVNHGSLLIMEGATQDDWQHQIPKEYHDRGGRINLTYRTIYPS